MEFEPFAEQRQAIEAPIGPVLVLAGPGAGKTFCLISRIAHLIGAHGLAPQRICTVTFTNKAAEEVAVRLNRTLGHRSEDITRGTLHALCLAALRDHGRHVGLDRGFGVADESYQRLLLRRLGVSRRRWSQLLNLFGRHRLAGYSLSEGDEALLDSYASLLREKNLVDFDELVALTAELFRRRPEIADEFARRWDYLLVDEFQDTSPAQYAVLRRLAWPHRNFFAVGDDEQSIYSWAGADPQILWRFREDFGIERPIVLDRNCRCSTDIFASARRLLAGNPVLFQKSIRAHRRSEHPVRAYSFADDASETRWILEDLERDRAESGRDWGDYALLYRRHRIGRHLEDRLIAAGIPCRLARGRALLDDPVIAYVVASLRLIGRPDDPVAVEDFADRMLPGHLLEHVRAARPARRGDFLGALRSFARARSSAHPDTKKAWRFIYHIENLEALCRSHDSLGGLVEELLSQRVGRYRNSLEERYDEISDPFEYPGAVELADRLSAVAAEGGRVWIEPAAGLEIALRGMLIGADFPATAAYLTPDARPDAADLVLRPRRSDGSLATTLFKALQLVHSRTFLDVFPDYVTFDLETTGRDPATCEIVEIGAVRVRDGAVVDRFGSLVRTDRPISAQAREIHGYGADDLREAPSLEAVWPRFRAFVGDDLLIAHNAHEFDVPVLRRSVAAFGGVDDLVIYDTLPLARSLFRASARLVDLADRFDVDTGRAHHAVDDALTLAHIFHRLSALKLARARKAAAVDLLDYLALGLALESSTRLRDEDRLLLEIARVYALGRYSDCLEFYAGERARTPAAEPPDVRELIERLGGHELMNRIRAARSAAERYPAAVARLRTLIESSHAPGLDESVGRLLDRVALSSSEGVEAHPHRVNLLTLHSTKGLEFSRVYIVGVEDYEIPGYYAIQENRQREIEEARRLLYVGMTRARDRLVLTRTDERSGRPSGGSLFLDEIGLTPARR